MSLLSVESTERKMALVQKIFDRQFQKDDKINEEYNDYRKRMMLRDILYNLECLEIAIKYRADLIFKDNASWLVKFLVFRMNDLPADRIKEQLILHYKVLKEVLEKEYPEEKREQAFYHLDNAIKATENADLENIHKHTDDYFESGPMGDIRKDYLNSLLEGDKHTAKKVIDDAIDSGVTLLDIYMEVFQKVLGKIGDLWHTGSLSVDKEHYCTAITQSIMGQLYPMIFSQPRNGCRVVACCIGNELHEMSIRMVCDILEIYGWDSIYLGSAVPSEGIINSLREHKPDMLALSVTMPYYLESCREAIFEVKKDKELSDVKIAVGGRAFQLAPHLPGEWGADISVSDGVKLAKWAKNEFKLS